MCNPAGQQCPPHRGRQWRLPGLRDGVQRDGAGAGVGAAQAGPVRPWLRQAGGRKCFIVTICLCLSLQSLVVAGGWGVSGSLYSTELLRPGASAWTSAASLPNQAWGMGSASLAGRLFLSGGRNDDGDYWKGDVARQLRSDLTILFQNFCAGTTRRRAGLWSG